MHSAYREGGLWLQAAPFNCIKATTPEQADEKVRTSDARYSVIE